MIRQVIEAIAYMHENGIAHRDLKPENLLCVSKDSDAIKITDFGLSKEVKEGDMLTTSCGTPAYAAPEIVAGDSQYDNTVDVWSIGVITYILLCGFPPFQSNDPVEFCDLVLKAKYSFPNPEWKGVSDNAKDFIKKIFQTNPSKRPSAKECLKHPWLQGNAPPAKLESFRSFHKVKDLGK